MFKPKNSARRQQHLPIPSGLQVCQARRGGQHQVTLSASVAVTSHAMAGRSVAGYRCTWNGVEANDAAVAARHSEVRPSSSTASCSASCRDAAPDQTHAVAQSGRNQARRTMLGLGP
eukprot:749816-Hanusia_phi.AAC.7